MSRYTLELRYIEQDKNFKLFPNNFPFYTDDKAMREDFIKKFYNEYRFREIGFETVGRFQTQLLSKLYNIMPYYIEFYKSVLVQNNMDFMTTKDITDTFTREVDTESNSSMNNSASSEQNSMSYDTPNTSIADMSKYPTYGSEGNGKSSSNGSQSGSSKVIEKTTYNSKGNLGVSSDGFLLEKWREVIANIDMLILEELEDLFFQMF